MKLRNGMKVLLRGRYEDFTDHLDGLEVTILDCKIDAQGYLHIEDTEGVGWYVQAIDVKPIEN